MGYPVCICLAYTHNGSDQVSDDCVRTELAFKALYLLVNRSLLGCSHLTRSLCHLTHFLVKCLLVLHQMLLPRRLHSQHIPCEPKDRTLQPQADPEERPIVDSGPQT